ncbi:MAG: coxA1 [Phycisphaerales bacterium]|nr:coxA1 [Phycisphaerales bacterium]
MTVAQPTIEMQRSVADARHLAELDRVWQKPRGVYGWLTTTDHKEIGLRFVCTACIFACMAGVLALLMRIQLATPKNTFLGPDAYNQIFTTHGTAMIFLFAVPVMEGMGLYLVPLMIGTRNVAFPRLLNFSYYVYLFAGLALFGGLLCNMGPDAGWFAYVPLSGPQYSPGHRVDLWSLMFTLVEFSALSSAVEFITTIFKQRAVGMSLNRMPMFVWAQLVTAFMVIFAMPAVMLCSTMLSMDRLTNIGTHFYNPSEGGDALLWQHLFWFFGHPDVYIIFIPATGFVSSIVVAFSGRKLFGYTAMVLALISTAFIGFGVWVHHMFATPLPDLGQGLFTASSLMIVIPAGLQQFCWIATLWGGRVRLELPLWWVVAFIATFVIGGLTGVMLASVSIDLQMHDTYFVVAHLHYVLIGGAVFPLFGAFYYWFPKFTGRLMNTTLGWWNLVLTFVGFHMTFWPMHLLGVGGMTRRRFTYPIGTNWAPLNIVATVGAFITGVAVLLLIINVLWSRKRGRIAGDNPWNAGTLEWATTSPPPRYNFKDPPTCQGREPVWENRADAPIIGGLDDRSRREVLCTTILDAAPDHRYCLAGESLWPLLLAFAVAGLLLAGGIFNPWYAVYGLIAVTLALFGWFWTSTLLQRHPAVHAAEHSEAAHG